MKIKFYTEIKSWEWLYIAIFVIVVVLLANGQYKVAIEALTDWIKVLREKI
jgi:hypothetical protein